jgi:hypothetical protein
VLFGGSLKKLMVVPEHKEINNDEKTPFQRPVTTEAATRRDPTQSLASELSIRSAP